MLVHIPPEDYLLVPSCVMGTTLWELSSSIWLQIRWGEQERPPQRELMGLLPQFQGLATLREHMCVMGAGTSDISA